MPNKFISNGTLRKLLEHATDDERLALTKVLSPYREKAFSVKTLQEEICLEGGHALVNLFRNQGTGYLDIVDDVADELKISDVPSYFSQVRYFDEIEELKFNRSEAERKGVEYAEKIEEKIILKVLEMSYAQMTKDQKKSFDSQINHVAKEFNSNVTRNLSGAAGLMVLGNLGGFATYTFLTSAMSTLTMGTLGFGAYTAATTLLSIALGPVGWAGLGTAAIYTLGRPDSIKLVRIVAMVGALRQRVKYEDLAQEKANDAA